jgi:hypothetical protein
MMPVKRVRNVAVSALEAIMLWILLSLFSIPACILAIALVIWLLRGRPKLGNPDQPYSIDAEIARDNLMKHSGPW